MQISALKPACSKLALRFMFMNFWKNSLCRPLFPKIDLESFFFVSSDANVPTDKIVGKFENTSGSPINCAQLSFHCQLSFFLLIVDNK